MKYEVLDTTESQLLQIHRNKTGALINAAVQMGAAAAGANQLSGKHWSSMPMDWVLCSRS